MPGVFGHDEVDANTWAKWGFDYLKLDNCMIKDKAPIVGYYRMRDTLNKTGRSIYFSLCNWGGAEVWKWGAKVGNSWRTTGDIRDEFETVRYIYENSIKYSSYAGIGGWNDFDMLEVGNGEMSTIEYKTHFTLWAMAKSPLIIGCDLENITAVDLAILSNKEVIDLNQDKLGKSAYCVKNCDYSNTANVAQFSLMDLEGGDYAISLTNWKIGRAHV